MNKGTKKIRRRKRKCHCCGDLYKPDPRVESKQMYCCAPECRKASQAASWARWFNRPENKDYYKGPEQVEKTQDWRRQNPGYWKKATTTKNALPKEITAQDAVMQGDSTGLNCDALPKEILSQPALLVGLIANLTGSALPKEIAESSMRFLHLGQDILGIVPGISPKGGLDGNEMYYMSGKVAACTAAVQLGGPPTG